MTNLEVVQMLLEVDKSDIELNAWEKTFVADLIDKQVRVFSDRQKEIIRGLHDRCQPKAKVVFKHKTESKTPLTCEPRLNDMELAEWWCDRWAAKQADVRHPTLEDKTERKVIRAMRNLFHELNRFRREEGRNAKRMSNTADDFGLTEEDRNG
jgi:hypothetical protein